MAINEQIVTGRKFRKLIDAANKKWQRISFWTKAGDVEFNDGKTAEMKLGGINGITSDLSCKDATIAASMTSIANLLTANNKNFYFDYQDGKYGYNTDPNRGADTFSPFNSASGYVKISNGSSSSTNPVNVTENFILYNDSGLFKNLVIISQKELKPTIKLNDVKITYELNQLIDISATNKIAIQQSRNTFATGGTVSMSWSGYLLCGDIIPQDS